MFPFFPALLLLLLLELSLLLLGVLLLELSLLLLGLLLLELSLLLGLLLLCNFGRNIRRCWLRVRRLLLIGRHLRSAAT